MRYRSLIAVFLLSVVAASAFVMRHRPQTYTAHFDGVLGTSLDITLRAESDSAAAAAEAAILAQIDHDSKRLSSYDPESEFGRWFATRDAAISVSPELFTVLSLFDAWRTRTQGALDPAAETVSRVWRTAAARQQIPEAQALQTAVAEIRQVHWRLDAATHTATHLTTAPLVLNSFTKSYIVERAASAATQTPGVTAAIVNVGGDVVARGDWTVRVDIVDPRHNADNDVPMAHIDVRDRAVATSGGYRRGFDIAGRHYSHIVDPRTGLTTGHVLSATVVSPDAVNAGALATSFCVLSPDDSERLATEFPGTEFLLVLEDGSRIESAGWAALVAPVRQPLRLPTPVASLYAAEQASTAGYEVGISVELARNVGRRPYLAVWIEDKDKFPIRTLALWFDKNRFLPELRAWTRSDRLRSLAEGTQIVSSVSSATRSPGKYTFSWDGKDGAGKVVKPGLYTVNIEVSREHGTYQILRQDVDVAGSAKHFDLAPNTELASASIDYRKAAAQ